MTEPRVTCLCITRNRAAWLPAAVECFRAQAYANKELLIVADREEDLALIDRAQSADITTVIVEPDQMIGVKRNLGCSIASGELIAHWDDDDRSEAGRLTDQVARLLAAQKSLTGYHAMKFTNGRGGWWRCDLSKASAFGTSLLYRKAFWERVKCHLPRRPHLLTQGFPAAPKGEDTAFVGVAVAARDFIASDARDLMYASIHPKNTSPGRPYANWPKVDAPAGIDWRFPE